MDGNVIRDLCKELGIKKDRSSPYHPEGNGSAERAIGTLKSRLSAMCNSRGMGVEDWDLLLPEAVLLINSQVNKSTKFSPFKMVYGRECRLHVDNVVGMSQIGQVIPADVVRGEGQANRYDAQVAYKTQHDKTVKDPKATGSLKTGDKVLIKRSFGPNPKLAVKWRAGPYTLVISIGPVNWVVSNSTGVEKVVHMNLIKRAGTKRDSDEVIRYDGYKLHTQQQDNFINIPIPSEPVMTDTTDREAFRNNVLGPNNPPEPVTTRSGRRVRPVMGTRLIDQQTD